MQEGDDYPAVYVSWNDAVAFCEKLSELEGKRYRLPTEAEWEYACRAGTSTIYSFGNDESQLDDYAWYGNNSGERSIDAVNIWETDREHYADRLLSNKCRLHAVGQKRPNPFGLYDLHGNVWEWCSDWYEADYYASSPAADPESPSSGSSRVLRGGLWYGNAISARSSYRYSLTPDNRRSVIGIRVVCD